MFKEEKQAKDREESGRLSSTEPLAAPWPLWSSCLVCEGAGGTPFGSAAWGSSSGPAAFLTVALSSICCPLMTSMLFEKKKKKALKVQVKCLKDCHGSEYLESSD